LEKLSFLLLLECDFRAFGSNPQKTRTLVPERGGSVPGDAIALTEQRETSGEPSSLLIKPHDWAALSLAGKKNGAN